MTVPFSAICFRMFYVTQYAVKCISLLNTFCYYFLERNFMGQHFYSGRQQSVSKIVGKPESLLDE
jgi:hypothetical protein